ncbi:hypothetical protein [Kluyvera intermedia]|jgi:hypothetical protein|uniref:Uncharacterized protein n=1 Tax=Kluyvera intermedia TaxID=61648 RepID=A0AA95JVD2_KLUIN|nr:hypothetical protein [Kluyvera intermedia]WGL54783.1 hypothetical protein QBD33_14040 [Kluyvera intermedia]
MKIYTVDKNGDVLLQKADRIVAKFANGKTLELAASPNLLPPGIPDGLHVWGGRVPSHTLVEPQSAQLTITPVASNGVIISPRDKKSAESDGMNLFIAEDEQHLQPVNEKRLVITLSNGKTLEVMEDYQHSGLLVWGGREPVAGLALDELKKRTESLGFFPLAGNLVHLYPYTLVSPDQ